MSDVAQSTPASGSVGSLNMLKVRDDVRPFLFDMGDNSEVRPEHGGVPAWAGDRLNRSALRARIEPWLTSLFQADHLSLLVGSGMTTGLEHLAGVDSSTSMSAGHFTTMSTEIAAASQKSAAAAGRDAINIEDEIRTATQLLRGLEILSDGRADELRNELNEVLADFAASILRGEEKLMAADTAQRERALKTLVSFLMSFASRTGSRDRLGIFTTNYDRVIEVGAELAGLHLLDRFVGSVSPIFRSSRMDIDLHYNPPGIRGEPRFVEGVARFTKLHGSLDWASVGDRIRRIGLPFGAESIGPYLKAPGLAGATPSSLMIHPNASKDRETAEYPYVELFRDFAAAVVRPNSTIVTYGYSFGDEHINRVIRDTLTIPSTHLVIISFGDPLGRIKDAYEKWGRESQISLLLGPELGSIETLTAHYLPKPSIDVTSRRMGDLLRQRYGTGENSNAKPAESRDNVGGGAS